MIRAGSAARRSFTRSANTGGPRILDIVGVSAAAAYSLRRLRAAYTGAAVNVRRSSDSTTQDIGFVNGSLDTSALSAFIGAGSGFVAKWYDQSGGANDAVQTTAANQPTLTMSVAALGGRPGMLFADASAISLAAAGGLSGLYTAGGTQSTVVNQTGAPTQADRVFENTGTRLQYSATALQFAQSAATTAGSWVGAAIANGGHVIDTQYSSASLSNVPIISVDGSPQSLTSTQPVGTLTGDGFVLFNNNNTTGVRGFPGHIVEHIAWKSNALPMAAIRANQKAYWGTP